MKKFALVILIGLFLLSLPLRAQINLLHQFTQTADDGAYPGGSPIISGSTIYGMTNRGGVSGGGTIFKMQIDGTGFTLLHTFIGGATDGETPVGSLILAGSTLYGVTAWGGYDDNGTIFKIQTDGSGFTLLHTFSQYPINTGCYPRGSLILSGSTLYGMSLTSIFRIQTDGTEFGLLHLFAGGDNDGRNADGDLLISGTTLYGMTSSGGANDWGTIFQIQTDGSGFSLLHTFIGGATDGERPMDSLIISNSTLYGMTSRGGDSDKGTIFKIESNGSGFTLLREFSGGTDDGESPEGSLILSGSAFYGMTRLGGNSNSGTIFKIETDGSGFTLLHKLAGGVADGQYPYGSLIISGTTLYGMTLYGGSNNFGVVFSLPMFTANNINVTSPNGGESWEGGSAQNITWSSTGTIDYVKLEYSINNGDSWNIISESTENDGIYLWTIPDEVSSQCLVKISDAGGAAFDVSDAVFSIIVNPTITVTAPNGGESWEGGTAKNITWSSTGTIANVKLEYSINSGTSWTTISASIANSGSYSWTVANTPASTCLVKVSDTASAVADTSNAIFTITALKSITVTAPNGGESWEGGTAKNITWSYIGAIANVKLEYSTNSGTSWNTISASIANSGSYNWIVANTPSSTCLVKVSDAAGTVADTSNAIFTITALKSITVTVPNGGEIWRINTYQYIRWNWTGAVGNVKIEYSTNSGSTWRLIKSSTANTGSYRWRVTSPTSTTCKVKVSSTTGSPSDSSNNVFRIRN